MDQYRRDQGGNTQAGFVRALYRDILNRPNLTQGEVNGWVKRIKGGMSLQTVAPGFYTSKEYRGKLAIGFYMQALHLAPRPDEQAAVDNHEQLLTGRDELDVLASLLITDECFNCR